MVASTGIVAAMIARTVVATDGEAARTGESRTCAGWSLDCPAGQLTILCALLVTYVM